jgi:hypothetical protein
VLLLAELLLLELFRQLQLGWALPSLSLSVLVLPTELVSDIWSNRLSKSDLVLDNNKWLIHKFPSFL